MTAKKRVPIDQATISQLREHAADVLGIHLSPNPNTSREKLIEQIRKHWDHDYILTIEASAPKAVAAPSVKQIEPEPEKSAQEPTPPTPPSNEANKPPLRTDPTRLDTDSSKDPRITIEVHRLPSSAGPQGGDRPVPVGINGIQMLIPRGKPVTIPYRFYLGLKDALRTEYEQTKGINAGEEDIISTDVQSYPFNVIKAPPREELIAWYRDGNRRIPDDLLAA